MYSSPPASWAQMYCEQLPHPSPATPPMPPGTPLLWGVCVRNVPHGPICLNMWSLIGGAIQRSYTTFGSQSREEVCFLVVKLHPSFQFSLSFLFTDENRISQLPVVLPCFPRFLTCLSCQVCVCMCPCVDTCPWVQVPMKPGRGGCILWSWNYRRLWATLCRCQEPNSRILQEQWILLTMSHLSNTKVKKFKKELYV